MRYICNYLQYSINRHVGVFLWKRKETYPRIITDYFLQVDPKGRIVKFSFFSCQNTSYRTRLPYQSVSDGWCLTINAFWLWSGHCVMIVAFPVYFYLYSCLRWRHEVQAISVWCFRVFIGLKLTPITFHKKKTKQKTNLVYAKCRRSFLLKLILI